MNQPIPTRGRKLQFVEMCHFVCGTNPSPLGDENLISDGIEFLITVVNQPIPKRGRKYKIVFGFTTINHEPTQPHSGTKIFRSSTSGKSIRNQPIPKGGRKLKRRLINHYLTVEPTHPHSGTKTIQLCLSSSFLPEPTQPQAGTKTTC